MQRIPTTLRIAALSFLLVLLTNLALLGSVRFWTYDNALEILKQRVINDSILFDDVYRTGGDAALQRAVSDAVASDPDVAIAFFNKNGRFMAGNLLAQQFSKPLKALQFQSGSLQLSTMSGQSPAGYAVIHFEQKGWLINGRRYNNRLALQATLERALLLAFALSVLMGIVAGVAIAAYVGRRVSKIAAVVDDVGQGNLLRRAALVGGGDAFDTLSVGINRMLVRITVLMDELRVLTDSLAHDLRSPVSRLRAKVEQALTETDADRRANLLAGVLDEADALTRMLTTVLEIGRSEAMTGVPQFETIIVAPMVEALAEMYEPLADESGMKLWSNVSEAPYSLEGHRQLLAQAVSNLIDNALKYGTAGSEVEVFSRSHGSFIQIGVADAGIGIADKNLAEARKKFGRLDVSRTTPGAGLGLALAEAVAHLHGGHLSLEDNAPGLRACLMLPVVGTPDIDQHDNIGQPAQITGT